MGMYPQDRAIYEVEVRKLMVDTIQLKDAENRGVQHTLLRQLKRRFGDPPANITAKLQELRQETLSMTKQEYEMLLAACAKSIRESNPEAAQEARKRVMSAPRRQVTEQSFTAFLDSHASFRVLHEISTD